jgi:hypothetical protein
MPLSQVDIFPEMIATLLGKDTEQQAKGMGR